MEAADKSRPPWRFNQSYRQDRKLLLRESIDDGVLQFSGV
jgi:hypothetical protein